MNLDVPDKLWPDFLRLLDIAQASICAADVETLPDSERETLAYVENLLEHHGECSWRWPTRQAQRNAVRGFMHAIGRETER